VPGRHRAQAHWPSGRCGSEAVVPFEMRWKGRFHRRDHQDRINHEAESRSRLDRGDDVPTAIAGRGQDDEDVPRMSPTLPGGSEIRGRPARSPDDIQRSRLKPRPQGRRDQPKAKNYDDEQDAGGPRKTYGQGKKKPEKGKRHQIDVDRRSWAAQRDQRLGVRGWPAASRAGGRRRPGLKTGREFLRPSARPGHTVGPDNVSAPGPCKARNHNRRNMALFRLDPLCWPPAAKKPGSIWTIRSPRIKKGLTEGWPL